MRRRRRTHRPPARVGRAAQWPLGPAGSQRPLALTPHDPDGEAQQQIPTTLPKARNSCRIASNHLRSCPGLTSFPSSPGDRGLAHPTVDTPVGCREEQKEQGCGSERWELKPWLQYMRAVWPQVPSLLSGPPFLPYTTCREASAL